MRTVFKILSFLAFAVSVAWIYRELKFDSIFAAAISLAAFAGCFVGEKKSADIPTQSQHVSGRSTGIQAGRDVNTGKLER